MANLAGKVEAEVEIKCDADEFFHSWGGKAHQLPNLCSEKLHNVEVHEGDWKTEGSAKLWTYVHEGKVETLKERLKIDEENKHLTADVIEGDPMKLYKIYKVSLQIITKGQSSFAKWSIDYEKINEDVPAPTAYLDWIVNSSKLVDKSLLKA
ncbi:unnamed protein product [Ilex paraguariensis]|uniref:Bet v I/Major latex protein domain-containing protein n=1 Tax=Ilex paraguariensis TaxID=185542 RepID=A0ABC8SCA8_9AQUA